MEKRGVVRILLAVLAVFAATVYLGELSDRAAASLKYRNDVAFKTAEIAELEDAIDDVTADEAERYAAESEVRARGNDGLEKSNGALGEEIAALGTEYENIREENRRYTEIYDELLKGKNKVEGYLAAGD